MSAEAAGELLEPGERDRLRHADAIGSRAPMLATPTRGTVFDDHWVFERKLDGVRVLASRDGAATVLWSRNRNDVTASYPEIAEELDAQAPERFIADGEVVAFDGHQTSFARLQHRMHLTDPTRARRTGVAVYYYVFDLLVLGEVDLTGLSLRTRKRLLAEAVGFTDRVRYSPHWTGDAAADLDDACGRGWEGLIVKRIDGRYAAGRSRDWLKLKCVREQDFVIGGFTDPAGSRQGFGALLVGYHDAGWLRYAGKIGTGYDEPTLAGLHARLVELERGENPFHTRLDARGVHWVAPELVARVGYSGWTEDGMLRHPRFRGLRTDTDPRER